MVEFFIKIIKGAKMVKRAELKTEKGFYVEEGNLENGFFVPRLEDKKNARLKFVLENLNEEEKIEGSYFYVENLFNSDESEIDEKYKKLYDLYEGDIDKLLVEQDFPFLEIEDYYDITDKEFNNFDEISKSTLTSQGLWSGYGIRKIEAVVKNLDELFNRFDKVEVKKLVINKKDNEDIEDIEFDVIGRDKLIIKFNTNEFDKFFKDEEKEFIFFGDLIIGGELRERVSSYFKLPFEIKIIDPKNIAVENDIVSIDFGTSSTCVACNQGKELIPFTDNPSEITDYENLTALILYNWKKIHREWENENVILPHFNRASENDPEKVDIRKEHYDYGNNVKDALKEFPSAKLIEATITEMKFIPKELEDDRNKKRVVKPFDDFKKVIKLTDLIEEENDEILNPIALYGYLIGRSLNLLQRGKVYLNYALTVPVNFNENEREKLKSSLEYGIKKSIPNRIKDKMNFEIKMEESVALLGAAKKLKLLKVDKEKEATFFGVFDFGGGTIDFAYGIYRKSLNDERAVLEDEAEKYKNVVEIFKTDGVTKGGEILIDRLAYKIYEANKNLMKDENIPIKVPMFEKPLRDFPAKLFGDRHVDYVNLKTISEKLARKFFIEGNFEGITEIELMSLDNSDAVKSFEIDELELNEEKLKEFLREEIYESIEHFKNVLEEVMNQNKDRLGKFGYKENSLNDIKILLAGNASKSRFVESGFEEILGDIVTERVENTSKDITVKNAVAKGQAFLKGTGIYNHSKISGNMPLTYYIWNIEEIEEEGDKAVPVLNKGDNIEKEWQYIGRRDGKFIYVYYSEIRDIDDEDDEELFNHSIVLPEFMLNDNFSVYVKPENGKIIKIALGDTRGNIDEENYVLIDLETGKIKEEK